MHEIWKATLRQKLSSHHVLTVSDWNTWGKQRFLSSNEGAPFPVPAPPDIQSLALCGHWAPETYLVKVEMFSKYKIVSFKSLYQKQKYSINFYMDYYSLKCFYFLFWLNKYLCFILLLKNEATGKFGITNEPLSICLWHSTAPAKKQCMERKLWGESVMGLLYPSTQSLVGSSGYWFSSCGDVQRPWEWVPDSGVVPVTPSEVGLSSWVTPVLF